MLKIGWIYLSFFDKSASFELYTQMSEKSLDATWAAEGYLASRRLLGWLGGLPFKTVCAHVVFIL
jgi:hypothetical protein